MGFLRLVDWCEAVHVARGFNPFQGFGGVSAKAFGKGGAGCSGGVLIPFRVLVGFLRACRSFGLWLPRSRFNPFQGFGGVSACALGHFLFSSPRNGVLIPFRVLVGFLQGGIRQLGRARGCVLIPFRVLVGFLLAVGGVNK